MTTLREVRESPISQGSTERIAYTFDFTALGTPTTPTAGLYNLTSGADATSTSLTGSATVDGNIVTTPLVHTLTAGSQYKLTVTAVVSGNTLSAFCIIDGEL